VTNTIADLTTHDLIAAGHGFEARLHFRLVEGRGGKVGGDLADRVQHRGNGIRMRESNGQVIEPAVLTRSPLLLRRNLQKKGLRGDLHRRYGT